MVLITFRTINSKTYKLELDPSVTIGQAKELFSKEVEGTDPSSMKMILKAKLLNDAQTIGELNLGEKDFIVVHINKRPAAKPQQPAASAPPPAVQQEPQSAPSAPAPGPSTAPLPEITRGPPQGQVPQMPPMGPGMEAFLPPGGQQQRLEDSPEFEGQVQQLMELGFDRNDCVAALKAAFGNPDRAYDYLSSGNIPDVSDVGEDQIDVQRNLLAFRNMLQNNPDSLENIIQIFETSNPVFRQSPELLIQSLQLDPSQFDFNAIRNRTANALTPEEFQQALVASMGGIPSPAQPPYGAGNMPTAGPPYGVPPGGVPPVGAPPYGAGMPGAYPGFPGAPPSAPPYGAPGAYPGPPPQEPFNQFENLLASFTPEERDAIKRLQDLGNFPLALVVQCYNACDKNEELAANLLFSMND